MYLVSSTEGDKSLHAHTQPSPINVINTYRIPAMIYKARDKLVKQTDADPAFMELTVLGRRSRTLERHNI